MQPLYGNAEQVSACAIKEMGGTHVKKVQIDRSPDVTVQGTAASQ